MTLTFEQICEVEDSLQEAAVFWNPFLDQPAHSDSYGTLVRYPQLDAWWASRPFTAEQLRGCVDYWLTNPNMQPPLRLVAGFVQRQLAK